MKGLERVESDWCHNWCLFDAELYDYVKGPLISPMLTVSIPYTINQKLRDMGECDCGKRLKEYYSKSGIPNPWDEYIILRREEEDEEEEKKDFINIFPKVDLDITKWLARNHPVYLGQGIPDPWKKLMTVETAEPNFHNIKKNFKSYADDFKIGTEHEIYGTEKVCCPNCNRNLILLCFRRSKKTNKDKDKEVENIVEETVPVIKPELVPELVSEGISEQVPVPKPEPIQEKIRKKPIIRKDASVETDWIHKERKKKVITKICKCKTDRICYCYESGIKCVSCPVCYRKKSDIISGKCKNYICCACRKKSNEKKDNVTRDNVKRRYYYTIGSMYPSGLPLAVNCESFEQNSPWMAQRLPDFGSPETNTIPQKSMNSYFQNKCMWLPQQFIGLQEENHHGLQLQLICPKCEKKRNNRRKGRRDEKDDDVTQKEGCLMCHCEELRRMKRRNWDGFACFCPYRKAIEKAETREISKDKTPFLKPILRKSEDRDYLNMLEMFGLKDHSRKGCKLSERENLDCSHPPRLSFSESGLPHWKTSLDKANLEAIYNLNYSHLRRNKLSRFVPDQMKKRPENSTSEGVNSDSRELTFPTTDNKPQFSVGELRKDRNKLRRPRYNFV